jgi:hypothetical protein
VTVVEIRADWRCADPATELIQAYAHLADAGPAVSLGTCNAHQFCARIVADRVRCEPITAPATVRCGEIIPLSYAPPAVYTATHRGDPGGWGSHSGGPEEISPQVREALRLARVALAGADRECRDHGRGWFEWCYWCRQPWRVDIALAAIEALPGGAR